MAIADPNELWPELEKLGEAEVRRRVVLQVYSHTKLPTVEAWLKHRDAERISHASTKSQRQQDKELKLLRSSKNAAWVAALAAILSVIIAGIAVRHSQAKAAVQAVDTDQQFLGRLVSSGFIQGAALALISAALGFLGARSKDWFERRRARKTLSSGLLSELRWLDGILRQIAHHGPASFYDPLDHPFTEAAIAQLTLFDHTTAQRIAHFHAMLRDVRAGMNEYRARPNPVAQRRDEYKRFVKGKAYFAAKAIPAMKDALLKAGGSMPPVYEETTIDGQEIPPLPPSSFGKLPGDDVEE